MPTKKVNPEPETETRGLYFAKPIPKKFIKSGCHMLDLALGGGWARSRISNIVGDRSTGKTLLAIEACANFALQEPKGRIRYREAESAFDVAYAQALGFPVDRVDFGEPMDTIEDLFEDLEKVIAGAKAKIPELYIIDSLDALSDREEMDREIDEGSYGTGKAKKLSQLFRRQIRGLAEKDITLMVISQVRDNIGVMIGKKYTRSGGRALDFYVSQRLDLQQIERIKRQIKGLTRVTGIMVKGVLEKNKISTPHRDVKFPIMFGMGVDDEKACRDFLSEIKVEIPKGSDLTHIQRMCSSHWYEIEKSLLPTKPKYGA